MVERLVDRLRHDRPTQITLGLAEATTLLRRYRPRS